MGRGLCYKFAVLVVLPLLAVISYYVVDQPQYFGPVVIDGSEINFSRNVDGVMTFEGKDIRDFARGLGYAHAHDRLVQMTLQKKISLGRLTDDVAVSEQSKRVDRLFRQLNFAKRASRSVSLMTEEEKQYYVDYCNGFNHYIDTMWIPPVEYLLGRNLKPEHWTPEDCAMTFQLVAYVGLSSLQTDIEKVIIEVMAANHLPNDKIQSLLADLFPKQTTTLDDELISYVRQLKEYKSYLNAEIVSDLRVLDTLGSNNWVVSGEHTRSGFPLQANDPHLQVDRLPTVFYEFIFYQKQNESKRYASGISAPGFSRTNYGSYQ